jgi:hypothetical protein
MSEMPSQTADRKRPAYLTVLYVVIGLLAFFLVTAGLGIWMFLRSETGQKIVSSVGKGITLMQEASKAPGTEHLRERGCSQAMVIPFERMIEVLKEFAPEAEKEFNREDMPGVGTMVVCQVSGNESKAPTCDEVARVYAAAVAQAPERFGVSVQRSRGAACEGTYTRDGRFIEPLQRPRGGRTLPWDAPIERQ